MVGIDERSNTVSWFVGVSLLFVSKQCPHSSSPSILHQKFNAVSVGLLAIPFPPILLAIEVRNPTSGTCVTIGVDVFPPLRIGMDGFRRPRGMAVGRIGFRLSRTHGMSAIHALLAITPEIDLSFKIRDDSC